MNRRAFELLTYRMAFEQPGRFQVMRSGLRGCLLLQIAALAERNLKTRTAGSRYPAIYPERAVRDRRGLLDNLDQIFFSRRIDRLTTPSPSGLIVPVERSRRSSLL